MSLMRLLLKTACLLALGLAAGCGTSKPDVETSSEEATVSGTVYLGGEPAESGEIVFDASNYKRRDVFPVRARIGEDGTYSIKTLVGENLVGITELNGISKDFLYPPPSFDVQSGSNTHDIRIGGAAKTGGEPDENQAGFEG